MKKQLTTLLVFTLLVMAFTSCRKETLVQPENTTAAGSNDANAGGVLTPITTYKLTKRGNDTIMYDASWRIIKVQGAYQYTLYTYGANTINSKTYDNKYNMLDEEITYQLDPATGRATESVTKAHSHYSMGDVITTRKHTYQYDANGRLAKKINKDKPLERMEFKYQDEDRLSSTFAYAADGKPMYGVHTYYDYMGEVPLHNNIKLNPEKLGLDIYLKIFGKFSSDLIIHYIVVAGNIQTSNEAHHYTINRNGYPTLLKKENGLSGSVGGDLGTLTFSYQAVQ